MSATFDYSFPIATIRAIIVSTYQADEQLAGIRVGPDEVALLASAKQVANRPRTKAF